jgi:hypothetical protein
VTASPLAVRAAAASLYWAREPRRDAGAVLGCVRGLSDAERAEVTAVLESGVLDGLPDCDLLARMNELAAKSTAAGGAR